MELLLERLENLPFYKALLKLWCRKNQVKVSFLVSMTLSKSKAINAKLLKTYEKGFGKSKIRWLENELKLFHFSLLAISAIYQTKIKDFGQIQWTAIREAFSNKDQTVLEYETMNFITDKSMLRKKWETAEDQILTEIIRNKIQNQLKWNQIAVDLYMQSKKKYFRSSKQCRERWLNHLDSSIKREKWRQDQDKKLISCVLRDGKKWSQIMRNFQNQRTEHMIKNRFISLLIKFKKNHPMAQDEDEIIKGIATQMGLLEEGNEFDNQRQKVEKKLRPKYKNVEQIEEKKVSEKNDKIASVATLVNTQCIESRQNQRNTTWQESTGFYNFDMQQGIQPAFFSPITYMTCNTFPQNCNTFANSLSCFQLYMNYCQGNQTL